ncbi:MAG: TonB-dependent receptor plug domain-containing protein, partial [Pseudomonadota bacterium]
MKLSKLRGCVLLSTSMLCAPSLAFAQDPAPTDFAVTDEIIVLGRNIPNPQRSTSQIASFLSEADLERTGDSNAALALTRLSGLSVVGGKFAFVRGLGDRYSTARLNGSPLPSPEPLRRTVPLNLFPSNILSGATVQKTFSTNYPGEFGGGIIDLTTVNEQVEPYLKLKAGIGLNTVSSVKDGIYVNGGDLDWLGYDDGIRDFPDGLRAAIDNGTLIESLSPAEIETIGESLVNSPLSVIQRGTVGPDFNGS